MCSKGQTFVVGSLRKLVKFVRLIYEIITARRCLSPGMAGAKVTYFYHLYTEKNRHQNRLCTEINYFYFRTLGSLVKLFERKFLFGTKLRKFYEKMIYTFAANGRLLLLLKYKYFWGKITDRLHQNYIILQGRYF